MRFTRLVVWRNGRPLLRFDTYLELVDSFCRIRNIANAVPAQRAGGVVFSKMYWAIVVLNGYQYLFGFGCIFLALVGYRSTKEYCGVRPDTGQKP